MRLQLPLLSLLFQSIICSPINPDISSSSTPNFALSDPFAQTTSVLLLNASSTFNTSLTGGPYIYPHRFRVPTTNTVLYLGFDIVHRPIDLEELRSLLLLARAEIQRGIDTHGPSAHYPSDHDNRRIFSEHGLGTVSLEIRDYPGGYEYRWIDLWNVVEGLRLYLLEGRTSVVTYFTFCDEPETKPHYRLRLGHGRIIRGNRDIEK